MSKKKNTRCNLKANNKQGKIFATFDEKKISIFNMEKVLQIIKKTPPLPHRKLSKNQKSLLYEKQEVRWPSAQASPRPRCCSAPVHTTDPSSAGLSTPRSSRRQEQTTSKPLGPSYRGSEGWPLPCSTPSGLPGYTQLSFPHTAVLDPSSHRYGNCGQTRLIPLSHLGMPDLLHPELSPPPLSPGQRYLHLFPQLHLLTIS